MNAVAVDDPFAGVVGQPAAVELLQAAVAAPVHAYLFVGATGWGTRTAARAFAGELIAAVDDPESAARHRHLATVERHPSIRVVERVGASISAEQAAEIVRLAAMSPPEGDRQVIVLVDFHLVGPRAPMLLKTIEEPPASTVFIVLAEDLPPELETIASRCVQVPFGPVPTASIRDALRADGVADDVAAAASMAAGGDLDRARLLARDPNLADRQAFWRSVPERLTGSGSRAAELVDELLRRVDEVLAPLEEQHRAEMDAAKAQVEQFGGTKGSLADLEARQKREARRIRMDELRAGLATMAGRYRDQVGSPGGAAAFVTAGSRIDRLCEQLVFNPNERLALEALLLDVPELPVES